MHNVSIEKYAIEKIIGSRFTDNNKVQLLVSGRETFQKILDSVASAHEIICIEFYIFKDDYTGKKLAELLKKKAGQGVRIYLLYDHFGSFLTSRRFWSNLKNAGVNISVSHPFRWSALRAYKSRNHKKLLIVDGKEAFTGGFNIADEYHGYFKKKIKVWRDTGIYLKGPIASTLLRMFRQSWAIWRGEAINWETIPETFIDGVPVIPIFANSGRARRRMRRLFIYSIKNAKRHIYLTTAYFIPGKRILRELIRAAKRGVALRLLLPGKSDVLPVFYAGRSYYARLLKAGVEIYDYEGAVLHAKTTVFDECWSIVGSANLDFQSLWRNDESNVGIFDLEFSRHMTGLFAKDLQNAKKIDLNTWTKRPLYEKLIEKIFFIIMKKL